MCGRYSNLQPKEAMVRLFAATPANDLPHVPNYNICPTDQVHAVTAAEGTRHLLSMRWGFIPHWYKTPGDGPLLINARAETIAEKLAFREACRTRRCLIPASGFYEWKRFQDGTRLPWYITRRDGGMSVFAGIWQSWERDGDRHTTCAIVTTAANAAMRPIHHRSPVILEEADWPLWLGEAGKGAARLMRPPAEDVLDFTRVSTAVNSNRASGPELIEPFDAVED